MSGLTFDDLIPRQQAAPVSLSFDDLVPQAPAGPSVASDVAASAGIGAVEGTLGLAGLRGDLEKAGRYGLGWLGDQTVGRLYNRATAGDWSPTTAGRQVAAALPATQPTTQDIRQPIEGMTGPFYQPQTTAGEFARTIGRNVPGAALGPGSALSRIGMAVASGAVEEMAGQATKGSAAEPYARAVGGVLGGAGAIGVQRAFDNAAVRSQIARQAPSADALRDASQASYRAAEDIGLQFRPEAFQSFAQQTVKVLQREGLDPSLTPSTTAALNRVAGLGQEVAPTLSDVDTLRKIASAAGSATSPADRRLAGMLVDRLDDFVATAKPQDVISGNPQLAAQYLNDARSNWGAMRRSELLSRNIDAGELSASSTGIGGNADNAIRQRFKNLLNGDPRRLRGFSEDEIAAMRDVATGGPVQNALRGLGSGSLSRGVLGGSAAAGAGYMLAGPAGAAATAGGAWVAKKASDAMTRRNADIAEALVRSRSAAAPAELQALIASDPSKRIDREALVRALLLSRELQAQPTN